jgi:hypothetical protein
MPVGNVRQAHGRVGLVDVLTAGPGSPIGVGPHVGRIDLDLDRVVDHRIDPGRGERGVALGGGVVGADAHQAVHAGLGLQPAIGVLALDQQGRRLDAHLVAVGLFDQFDVMPWALAQRLYMRSSMPAQSHDSVPPAPELIST